VVVSQTTEVIVPLEGMVAFALVMMSRPIFVDDSRRFALTWGSGAGAERIIGVRVGPVVNVGLRFHVVSSGRRTGKIAELSTNAIAITGAVGHARAVAIAPSLALPSDVVRVADASTRAAPAAMSPRARGARAARAGVVARVDPADTVDAERSKALRGEAVGVTVTGAAGHDVLSFGEGLRVQIGLVVLTTGVVVVGVDWARGRVVFRVSLFIVGDELTITVIGHQRAVFALVIGVSSVPFSAVLAGHCAHTAHSPNQTQEDRQISHERFLGN